MSGDGATVTSGAVAGDVCFQAETKFISTADIGAKRPSKVRPREVVFGSRGINSCHATAGNYASSWIVAPGTTALAISHRCW